MDALIEKLTNLGYEFFGIVLPGTFALLQWCLLWLAAGDVVPFVTFDTVPRLTVPAAMTAVRDATDWSVFMSLLLVLAPAYFVGHLLTWIGRGGRRYDAVSLTNHMWDTLRFRPPKLTSSYKPSLEPMMLWAGKKLLGKKVEVSWPTFYPAAKTYLLQQGASSVVTTYQNKYTLHRSLAAAAALTTWGVLLVAIVCAVAWLVPGRAVQPEWIGVVALAGGGLLAVWGFSTSYLYNWTLWGNYLITETFVCLRTKSTS